MTITTFAGGCIAALALIATPVGVTGAAPAATSSGAAPAGAPVYIDPGLRCQVYGGDGTVLQAYCTAPRGRRFQVTATCTTASVKSPVAVVPGTATARCPYRGRVTRGQVDLL